MRFQDLFRGYTGSHGVSTPTDVYDDRGKKKHKHVTRRGAPSEEEWQNHLSGKGPGLGVIPLLDDNRNVYWAAIDIDKYPVDFAALEKDASALPLVITQSKSKGAHMWLFCEEPTPAKLVIKKLEEWALAMGFGGSEIFPKQHTRLVGKDDQGNWINLPFFGNDRLCWYKGELVGLDAFLAIAGGRLMNEKRLENIKIESSTKDQLFSDGPPCLQALFSQGVSEGGRNNTLFNVGIYLKKKEPEAWAELFSQFNRDNIHPNLEESEVKDSTRTLERKPYNYTCGKHPLLQNCNRPLCVKREYGIAQGSDAAEMNVSLSGLTKIDTTTPRWLINIDGVRAEIPDTKVLMDQKQFGILVVERVHKVMTPVKPAKWNEEVQRLLNSVEVVEAPIEASPEGQFISHLANFIERRGQSQSRDQIVTGRVWKCDTCSGAYFKPDAFSQYLRREGFRDLSSSQMWSILTDHGVKRGRWNIKGATVIYWRVNMPSIQSEAFDVPSFNQLEGKKDESQYSDPGSESAF